MHHNEGEEKGKCRIRNWGMALEIAAILAASSSSSGMMVDKSSMWVLTNEACLWTLGLPSIFWPHPAPPHPTSSPLAVAVFWPLPGFCTSLWSCHHSIDPLVNPCFWSCCCCRTPDWLLVTGPRRFLPPPSRLFLVVITASSGRISRGLAPPCAASLVSVSTLAILFFLSLSGSRSCLGCVGFVLVGSSVWVYYVQWFWDLSVGQESRSRSVSMFVCGIYSLLPSLCHVYLKTFKFCMSLWMFRSCNVFVRRGKNDSLLMGLVVYSRECETGERVQELVDVWTRYSFALHENCCLPCCSPFFCYKVDCEFDWVDAMFPVWSLSGQFWNFSWWMSIVELIIFHSWFGWSALNLHNYLSVACHFVVHIFYGQLILLLIYCGGFNTPTSVSLAQPN